MGFVTWDFGLASKLSTGRIGPKAPRDAGRTEERLAGLSQDNPTRCVNGVQLITTGTGGASFACAFATKEEQRRYSPATCTGVKKIRIIGRPDPDHVSTSMVERSNLTLRTTTRRFTRLTTAYSRKAENHAHAVSLAFMAYNFCTPHSTLTRERGGIKCTPAMAAGVTDRVWKIEDVLARMDPDQSIV